MIVTRDPRRACRVRHHSFWNPRCTTTFFQFCNQEFFVSHPESLAFQPICALEGFRCMLKSAYCDRGIGMLL